MKPTSSIAFALLATCAIAPASRAEPAAASPASVAESVVQTSLVRPLAARDADQPTMSRARLPPSERRLEVKPTPQHDAAGRAFYAFTLSERHGIASADDLASWSPSIAGCVYLDRREVFVIQKGTDVRPASFLLGKYARSADPSTCRAAVVAKAR